MKVQSCSIFDFLRFKMDKKFLYLLIREYKEREYLSYTTANLRRVSLVLKSVRSFSWYFLAEFNFLMSLCRPFALTTGDGRVFVGVLSPWGREGGRSRETMFSK